MTEPLTMRAFHADDRTRDWRVVGDGAIAVFRIGSFAAGARLVQAIATAVGDGGPHHPDVDLQQDTVTVRLLTATRDYMGMTAGDVELAVRISDLAREQGLAADPTLIQTVQVTIDALVSAEVMPFWAAVLGYERRADSPDEDLVRPALARPVDLVPAHGRAPPAAQPLPHRRLGAAGAGRGARGRGPRGRRADGPRCVADMVDARRRRGQRGRRYLGDRPRLTGTRTVVLTLKRKKIRVPPLRIITIQLGRRA